MQNLMQKMKRLKSLQVKTVSYLEPNEASIMEFFCEYT